MSWLVTTAQAGTPSHPHHSPQKPQQGLPKTDPKGAPTCLTEEPGERRGHQPSAQPRLLCGNAAARPGAAGAAPAGSGKQEQAPAAGAGPGPPCPHTPTFPSHERSLPSPGNLRHPAGSGTQPGPPCQHRSPRSAAASRPLASRRTGNPASLGASRTFPWSTASPRDRGD